MDPELDKNHNPRNACGSGNVYCWNDMAAKSGSSPISGISCDRSSSPSTAGVLQCTNLVGNIYLHENMFLTKFLVEPKFSSYT
jgi:hypothetical protein